MKALGVRVAKGDTVGTPGEEYRYRLENNVIDCCNTGGSHGLIAGLNYGGGWSFWCRVVTASHGTLSCAQVGGHVHGSV